MPAMFLGLPVMPIIYFPFVLIQDGEIIYPREDKSLPSQDDQEDITMAIQSWFECEEGSLSPDNTHLHVPHAFTKR